MYSEKRGLSEIVSTVLLMLLSVAAVGLLVSFLVPFFNKSLGESKDCFDSLGDFSFYETSFNCYYQNSTIQRTGFSIRSENEDIVGFKVGLGSEGNLERDTLNEGEISSNIRMLNSNFDTIINIPGEGEVRTYVAKGAYTSVEISPILKSGESCAQSDKIQLSLCAATDVIGNLTKY